VHELDRAHVEAARRLRRDQDPRVAIDLASEDDLLLVASRERPRGRLRSSAADVELADQLARALDQPAGEEPAEAGGG
jgi:hypothetical protein